MKVKAVKAPGSRSYLLGIKQFYLQAITVITSLINKHTGVRFVMKTYS